MILHHLHFAVRHARRHGGYVERSGCDDYLAASRIDLNRGPRVVDHEQGSTERNYR